MQCKPNPNWTTSHAGQWLVSRKLQILGPSLISSPSSTSAFGIFDIFDICHLWHQPLRSTCLEWKKKDGSPLQVLALCQPLPMLHCHNCNWFSAWRMDILWIHPGPGSGSGRSRLWNLIQQRCIQILHCSMKCSGCIWVMKCSTFYMSSLSIKWEKSLVSSSCSFASFHWMLAWIPALNIP